MIIAARILVFLAGLLLAAGTVFSALETFILPRGVQDGLTRLVFLISRLAVSLPLKLARTYEGRDRILAFYAPISLLGLVPAWYFLISIGYAGMYWALGVRPWAQAYVLSGSSLLTLGYEAPHGLAITILSFTEGTLGLILVALLIAYLPSMYSAFQRRESTVTMLAVRAGNPPSVLEMLLRFHRIHGLGQLTYVWTEWERWFSDVEESHTSLPPLVFFRSPSSDYAWITSAGAVLDTASVTLSAVDIPADPQAMLCIRAGYLALRHIANFFDLSYPAAPHFPGDSISVTRHEFEQLLDQLAEQGVPLKADRDQAWKDFGGWRVNYDDALLGLCTLTMPPIAPWSSDRAEQSVLPPIAMFSKHLAKNNRAGGNNQ